MITPLGTRVFIQPIVEEQIGSIVLARMSRDMPSKGLVVAVSQKTTDKFGIGIGHRVIFDKHFQELSEDQKTTIVNAEHVLAIIT